jgi:hypothetical protein
MFIMEAAILHTNLSGAEFIKFENPQGTSQNQE